MKVRRIIENATALFFLSWILIPFGQDMSARAQDSGGSTADTSRMLIYGNNPNRKPPRDGDPVLDVRFIPDSIMIGDLVTLRIELSKDIVQMVALPEFEDGKVGDMFEIVAEGEPDTIRREGRRITVRKDLILQTFEDGYFSMGWFPAFYLDKNIADTIWSRDSLVLKVGTFQIDTLTQTIYDIKPIMDAPLKAGEVAGYAGIGLAVLILIGLLAWYIYTRRRNLDLMGKPKVIDPPHVAAIKALEALHNQKLWQNNKHKQYYTGITDILRQYMEHRWNISAMEMTSDEIMAALKDRELPGKSYTDLGDILGTADLVKFAKYVPVPEYNETVFTNSYYFIEETKPTEVEKPAASEDTAI